MNKWVDVALSLLLLFGIICIIAIYWMFLICWAGCLCCFRYFVSSSPPSDPGIMRYGPHFMDDLVLNQVSYPESQLFRGGAGHYQTQVC